MAQLKNQDNPRWNFYTFSSNFGKRSTFSGKKANFSRRNSFLSGKNSDDFFLVIDYHFQIFTRHFQISSQNLLPNSYKFVTFSRKTLNSCIFSWKPKQKPKVFQNTLDKTQGPQKKTKIRSKNPRSREKTQGVATLPTMAMMRISASFPHGMMGCNQGCRDPF